MTTTSSRQILQMLNYATKLKLSSSQLRRTSQSLRWVFARHAVDMASPRHLGSSPQILNKDVRFLLDRTEQQVQENQELKNEIQLLKVYMPVDGISITSRLLIEVICGHCRRTMLFWQNVQMRLRRCQRGCKPLISRL